MSAKTKISKFPITNKFLWNPKTLKCWGIGWTSFESTPPSYVMSSLLKVECVWTMNASSFPQSKLCVCVRLLFYSLFLFCFPQVLLSSYFVFKFFIFFYFPLSFILLLPPYFICSMCKISILKILSWPYFNTNLKSSFKKSNNN